MPIATAHVATGALLLGTALAFTVGSLRIPLGRPGHRRYRVKWDERHESIVFPADGVSITPASRQRSRRSSGT